MKRRRQARAPSTREAFWAFLEAEFPASALWWGGRPAGSVTGGAWTTAGFLALAERLRTLARALEGRTGEEVIWRRYAARALVAIQGGAWRLGHLPLQKVRRTLLTLAVDHALGGQNPDWEALTASLPAWIDGVEIRHRPDPRVSAAAGREAAAIERLCRTIDLPTVSREAIGVAVARYRERLDAGLGDRLDPMPWARAATVDVGVWRRRRAAFVPPPADRGDVPADPIVPVAPRRTIRVDLLDAGVWVARDPERGVAAGPDAREAHWTAALRAFWLQRAQCDPLTWALADPVYIEGAIEAALAEIAKDPRRSRGLRRRLEAFLTREEGMACADAWLWLDRGDPATVAEWLASWCGPDEAAGVVHFLAVNPGRLVERERIRAEVADEMERHGGHGSEWDGWRRGPVPAWAPPPP